MDRSEFSNSYASLMVSFYFFSNLNKSSYGYGDTQNSQKPAQDHNDVIKKETTFLRSFMDTTPI